MVEMLNNLEAPSDAELISRVRGGDVDAYGQLFARHVESARRLARQLVRGPDSEDLVSDAFAKVMTALQGGGGPDIAFRAYLLTAVRRLHVDRIRAQSRLTPSEDLSEFDPGVPFQDTVVEQFESGAAARAFASLPERWQMVLWHLEVERQKPADVAPLLGMTPNSVSALAYRAREGLRQAFLSAHLAEIDDSECCWVVENLGSYVRKGLSRRDTGKVQAHLDGCRPCMGRYLELEEVNSDLSAVIAPLLLGGLAAGYLTATGSGVAVGGGIVALLDRAKDFVVAHVAPVAAGTTAAGVAAAVVIVGGVGSGDRIGDPGAAEAPPSRVSGTQPVESASDGPGTGQRQKAGRPGPATTATGDADGEPGGDTAAPPEDDPTPPSDPAPSDDVPVSPVPTDPDGEAGPDDTTITAPDPDEQPDPEPGPSQKPPQQPQGQDIAVGLGGNYLSKGIGRFRTHVTNLPTGSGPTPLQFQVAFSHSLVTLERIPPGCSVNGPNAVRCSANGGTHNGIFDADMSAVGAGDTVTITVTVSMPHAPADPDPGDNTRSITLTRSQAGAMLAWD